MFFVSALAETNRVPFNLTEGESELVSGFNVEYCHIILMSALGVILFLGGGELKCLSMCWLVVGICNENVFSPFAIYFYKWDLSSNAI